MRSRKDLSCLLYAIQKLKLSTDPDKPFNAFDWKQTGLKIANIKDILASDVLALLHEGRAKPFHTLV